MKDRLQKAYRYLQQENIVSTQQELAKKLNLDRASVNKALNDKDGYLTDNFVEKFHETFSDIFAKDWLLTGKGSMLKSDKPKYNEVTPVPTDNYMMVEYADLRASAGRLGGSDVSQLPDTHKRLVPKEYENGGFLVVRVDGDSMDDGTKRSLSDGDEVLIKEKRNFKINELPIKKTLFVITTREGNVLKQIAEVNMTERYILCRSFNPDPQFDDFRINFDDIYQIFIVCKRTQSQISLV